MLWGYIRVSTQDQSLDLRRDAMERAGVSKVFSDEGVSGTVDPVERAGFSALLEHAREGDEIVAWRLDRVGRSAAAVLSIGKELRADCPCARRWEEHRATSAE
ncbi:hypothetical protein GCM10027052_20100 [Parafrigoribacterium mesophilum]|uniref:recombinase family protein n=1 Tax=Parafrigoribacterium mesophilum TaxID=433646 RepID=UPI003D153DB7